MVILLSRGPGACGRGDGAPWWRARGWRGCACCAPRLCVLTAATTMGLLTGSIYFGWASLAAMMLKSGSFASLCLSPDHQQAEGKPSGVHAAAAAASPAAALALCDEQEAAVQHLYSLTLFMMMCASSCAGVMMDVWGPRRTALLGYSLGALASVCLAATRWLGDGCLYLGCALLGAATDTAFLPLLTAARLFPLHSGFVICVLGSAASASFGVPPLLEWLAACMQLQRPLDCMWGYALAGPGLCLLLTCLFFPNSGFLETEPETAASSTQQQPLYEELLEERPAPEAGDLAYRGCTNTSRSNNTAAAFRSEEGGAIAREPIWTFVCSAEYGLLAVYFSVCSCAIAFYEEAPNRYFSKQVVHTLEAALPLSFIPCVLLGWLADACGVLTAMAAVTANGVLAYACALIGKEGWPAYLSVSCFASFISLFTSQIFMYVEQRFPASHFGRVVGSLQLIGGATALICNPLYSAVAVSRELSLSGVTQAFIVLLALQFLWLFCLGSMRKRELSCGDRRQVGSVQALLDIGKA
ncbi:hypothetical protein Efla_006600 [Eimeria flavescens]